MLHATVLGTGASPGQLLSARKGGISASNDPSSSASPFMAPRHPSVRCHTHVAHPRSVHPYVVNATHRLRRYDGSCFGEETLTWSGSELTWSRGVEVVQRMSFDYMGEDIACATFAWFRSPEEEWDKANPNHSRGRTRALAKSRMLAKGPPPPEGTFGPFHTSQFAEWMPRRTAPRRKAVGLQRVIVVVLQTKINFYFASGEEFINHAEFAVDACWALPTGGVLLQRAVDQPHDLRSRRLSASRRMPRFSLDSTAGDTSIDSLSLKLEERKDKANESPRLFTITEVFGDILKVDEAIIEGDIGPDTTSLCAHPTSYGSTPFIKPSVSVLFVAPLPYPFVVGWDDSEGTVVVYRSASVPPQETGEELQPEHTSTFVRPEDIKQGAKGRPSGGKTSDRRASAAADLMERSRHRGSRPSAGGEFPDGPETSARVARLRRASNMGVAPPAAPEPRPRRVSTAASMMREDMHPYHKVMDIGADDLRDTTMIHGLEETARQDRRSDVVLDRMWAWRPPRRPDPSSIRVFLSDNCFAYSVKINIFIPKAGLFPVQVGAVASPRPQYTFTPQPVVECVAAVPVVCTRPNVFDTMTVGSEGAVRVHTVSSEVLPISLPVLNVEGHDEVTNQFASSLSMALDGDGASIPNDRRVVDLVNPSGSRVTAVYNDGESVRCDVDSTVPPGLVRRTLDALSYALPAEDYGRLLAAFLLRLHKSTPDERAQPSKQWSALAETVLEACGVQHAEPSSQPTHDPIMRRLQAQLRRRTAPQRAASVSPTPATPEVVIALHLVAQDCRLSSLTEADLLLVAPVLLQLTAAIGRHDWVDYWRRLVPTAADECAQLTHPSSVDTAVLDQFVEPPDVLSYLSRATVARVKPFPTPQSVFKRQSPNGEVRPCRQTEHLTNIYARMVPGVETRSNVVDYLLDNGLDKTWLDDLTFGISMPIAEIIRVVEHNPPKDASPEVYNFIGREDLAMVCGSNGSSMLELPMGAEDLSDDKPTIGDIIKSVHHPGAKHAHYAALPHVRFGSDKRMEEVERIMQTTRQRTVPVDEPKGVSEQEIAQHYANYAGMLAQRTFAVTVGQGMWQYASRTTTIAHPWYIPPMDLSVKIVPAKEVYSPQIQEGAADWPRFHHAASVALSISPESKGIDPSWILYNRPDASNPEHGGFLLGLGLTGHLRKFGAIDAYSYLHQRHEKTTIGTVLGLAASFAGSQDVVVTKQISLHTTALLPPGAMDLNASPLVQATSLLAIGLVYAGTKHLHMADVTLNEIARQNMPGVEGFAEHREAYSFSAAMGFGLVMLGRGGKQPGAVENDMLHKLMRCIHGDAPDVKDDTTRRKALHIDPTITAPGATLALGLMYLRTGRQDIADRLEIPQTAQALESVRPDQLLIRTFARALIMWDDIRGTTEWVNEQIPSFIDHHGHKMPYAMLDLNTELAYFNIVAGACLAIGLRFTGRPPEAAHTVVMMFFSVLGKAAAGQSMTYEARIRRNAARQALNTVTLALSALMAGTGELSVFRRLRVSHGQEGVGVTYGSHMAMHMALGLLFLGEGYYSLGNSNIAIAALSIAFFPRFLANANDNRAYPQAFRHLWALAVEPRCLICRDVETRESVILPIKIRMKGDSQPQSHISPTPVAPFSTLESIYIDAVRYWQVEYSIADPRYKEHLVRTRTIWVKRRPAFLDYGTDPRGYRSMFVRTGVTSSYDMHYDLVSPASPLYISPDELVDLMETHVNDWTTHAVAKRFMGPGVLEEFIRNVLFECVVLDKPEMLAAYIGIVLALEAHDGLRLVRAAQVAFLLRFYRPTVYDVGYAAGERRSPLLRQSFLHALYRRLLAAHPGAAVTEYFQRGVWPIDDTEVLALYLAGNNVPPVRVLEALGKLVRGTGGGNRELLAFKARAVADKYAASVAEQYDTGAVGAATPAPDPLHWKLGSVDDGIRAWAA